MVWSRGVWGSFKGYKTGNTNHKTVNTNQGCTGNIRAKAKVKSKKWDFGRKKDAALGFWYTEENKEPRKK